MTAATQTYTSTDTSYPPTNMFAATGRNVPKADKFLQAFGNTQTSNRTVESQQVERLTPRDLGLGLATTDSSFFDFEPQSNATFPSQNQFDPEHGSGSMSGWASDMNFRPLSPPDSASFSPKGWGYNFQQQPAALPLANIQPSSTRAQYGQVTPPDDEDIEKDGLLDRSIREQNQQRQQQPESNDSASKKRKRTDTSAPESTPSSSKRNRKYTRGSSSSNGTDSSKPEDVRRSKFLERNRVAASKCRQKKKEWTQNLETRARDLQKNNSSLRMMVDSLRQEILFLKGEMLKHSSCGCTQIQEFLNAGANFPSTDDQETMFKREPSPFESMPPSRLGSMSPEQDLNDASPTAASIAGDDTALEALLTSSINHDTSEEGIASTISG